MDNSMPNDPPDDNPNGSSTLTPFGSNFNPHTNPVDPNNPYSSQSPLVNQNTVSQAPNIPNSANISNNDNNDPPSVHEEIARHRLRDEQGHFIPYKHPTTNHEHNSHTQPTSSSQTTPTPPNFPNTPNPSPPPTSPIQVIHGSGGSSGKDDDSLVQGGFKITNPFSAFFNFLKKQIKNSNVKISIPAFTFIGLAVALTGGGGIIGGLIVYFFPNSSPVLHRAVMYQGELQKNDKGFYLTLPNSDLYTLKPKSNSSINFKSLTSGPALVKGNLTPEKYVIEVSEIISLGNPTSDSQTTPTSQASLTTSTPQSSSEVGPNIPNQDFLPKLYSGITWETNQKKILTFTSGRRRIEQEGVYLESAQVPNIPQDFLNYYTTQLTSLGFKETLNSKDPDGTMITYSKDELFLTYGVKNIYSGTGDNKKIIGYRAYIEHN